MRQAQHALEAFALTDRVAVVTGGNTGLGLAMSEAFLRAGADVYATSAVAENDERLAATAAAAGRRHHLSVIDLAQPDAAQRIVDDCAARLGRLDVLVNNAGTIRRAPVTEHSDADWQAVIDINLTAAFRLSRAAARAMQAADGGSIINIASMLAFRGGEQIPGYTASKHGIAGLTRAFANELARDGIRVNAIAPGYMETPNSRQLQQDPVQYEEIRARIPAGRWGRADDIGGLAVFLASAAAAYITGAVIPLDGGYLVR